MPKKSQTKPLEIEDASPLTYEDAIKRVEEIADILDKGTATVDESLALFEESVGLIAFCTKKLDTVEQKIVKITEGK